MTHKENIMAILECYFTGFKEEIIDSACNRILELEPCEDTISRQAVIDMLNYGILEDNIKELPSVTPKEKTRWIPVTEDAPQKGTICLWCKKQGSVFISAITYRSESSSYVGKHGYFSNGLENYGDIVAWMPLPEPYKAESEET